jgi:hypothetical protein
VWYCALNDETRRTRLVARHVAFGKEPTFAANWARDVDEQNSQLIIASQTRADLIVPSEALDSVGAPVSDQPETDDKLM